VIRLATVTALVTLTNITGMILERKVVWDSKQSFTDFLDQWLTYYPNYKAELKAYNDSVDHYAMLIT